jgi:hypothetical protein
MRTGASARAANDPRNPVWKRKYMNSAKQNTCVKRRAHLRKTAMRRGAIPLPESPDFARFFSAGRGRTAVAMALAEAAMLAIVVDATEALAVSAAGKREVTSAGRGTESSAATGPALPVSQGMGSGWEGWVIRPPSRGGSPSASSPGRATRPSPGKACSLASAR